MALLYVIPFALTVFCSAYLLFAVQPLLGKYLLPWFGGGAGIWSTCLLLFQALLLLGYTYVYAIASLPARRQVMIHVPLLAMALLSLPVVPEPIRSAFLNQAHPSLQILAILICAVGLPFALLSTTGPLLQRWFSMIFPLRSPYPLYAVSNAGSLLALISYPFLVEPHLTRTLQARLWSILFVAYCGGAVVTMLLLRKSLAWEATAPGASARESSRSGDSFPLSSGIICLILPAISSALLLSSTNRICQDIAIVPFLWLLPLAVYTLSFILCFSAGALYSRWVFVPALLLSAGFNYYLSARWQSVDIPFQVAGYLAILFVGCMASHGELFRLRPSADRLAAFYLLIAAGGVLGSLGVAVAGPLIFSDFVEFELSITALCFLLLVRYLIDEESPLAGGRPVWATSLLLGVLCLGALALVWEATRQDSETVGRWRNFYGKLTLADRSRNSLRFHHYTLRHGRIAHGMQLADPEAAEIPTSYYGESSGVGLALNHLAGEARHIGVIGLGVGTLAAYGRPGDRMRFYEINPLVTKIAQRNFTYLSRSRAQIEVVHGDARVSLEREAPNQFDLLALDAFNGDAVPIHLLTREAFLLYIDHLKPNGIISVHISNRHLELRPVVRAIAREFGLHLAVVSHWPEKEYWYEYASTWVLLSASEEIIADPLLAPLFRAPDPGSGSELLWTDEYASLVGVLR